MLDFFKRHRRKFVGTGIFVGGSYALYRYVKYKIEQQAELKIEEMIEQSRKTNNFQSNQQSCLQTVVSFLPNLQTIIARYFDSQQLRTSLDENPKKKLEIWSELMVLSVCRCVASFYSLSLLYMLIRVQVNVLAGHMFKRTTSNTSEANSSQGTFSDQQLRKAYLSEMRHFLTDGLKFLMDKIEVVVRQHMKNISLKDQMNLSNIESLLVNIKNDIDYLLEEGVNSENWNSCNDPNGRFTSILLPSGSPHTANNKSALEMESGSDLSIDQNCNSQNPAGISISSTARCNSSTSVYSYLHSRKYNLYKYLNIPFDSHGYDKQLNLPTLLMQTKDILDMTDFMTTVDELTNHSILFLTRQILPNHSSLQQQFKSVSGLDESPPSFESLESSTSLEDLLQSVSMPIAKWVPILDSQLYTLCQYDHTSSNCLLMHLHSNRTAKLFSENVYEAFLFHTS